MSDAVGMLIAALSSPNAKVMYGSASMLSMASFVRLHRSGDGSPHVTGSHAISWQKSSSISRYKRVYTRIGKRTDRKMTSGTIRQGSCGSMTAVRLLV